MFSWRRAPYGVSRISSLLVFLFVIVLLVVGGYLLFSHPQEEVPTANQSELSNVPPVNEENIPANINTSSSNDATGVGGPEVVDFSDSERGFSISYPVTWEKASENLGTLFRYSFTTESGGLVTMLIAGSGATQNAGEGASMVSEITVDGVKGSRYEVSDERSGTQKTVVAVTKGGKTYTFSGPDAQITELLSSFSFL